MSPSGNASDRAKARLAALDKDPDQQKRNADPQAIDETREDDHGDPKLHRETPDEPGWWQDKKGGWHHADYEKVEP